VLLRVVAYSVTVDGTQDISGHEQQSICLQYVDKQLKLVEAVTQAFIGMHEPPGTTRQTTADCVLDVLIRMELPVSQL